MRKTFKVKDKYVLAIFFVNDFFTLFFIFLPVLNLKQPVRKFSSERF